MTQRIRTRHTHQDYGRYITVAVTIDTAGAVALDQTTSVGNGAVITRTGVGEYLMTTSEPAKAFIGGHAHLALATPIGAVVQCGAVTQTAAGTFTMVIQIFDNTAIPALYDPAALAGNTITGYMTLKIIGP